MVKFVSIFVVYPQNCSLCISLLETRSSVMTGSVSNIIKEKERPKLSSVESWLIFLVLAECKLVLCSMIKWLSAMAFYDFAYKIRLSSFKKGKTFLIYIFQMKTISVYYFLKHSDIAYKSVEGLLIMYPDTCFQSWSPSIATFTWFSGVVLYIGWKEYE